MTGHGQTPPHTAWSNRFFILAVAGILFLTLYPFRFSSVANLAPGASPFLLGTAGKPVSRLDAVLNVLLFIPFGFGLSACLRQKGRSLKSILLLNLVAGALFSYAIEFVQLYIPARDSGWEDIFTNSTGAVVGFFVFLLVGKPLVHLLSLCESALESWLTPIHVTLALLVYFGVWYAVSVRFEKETQFSNWEPEAHLVVGNEAAGRPASAWKGELHLLQIWDRALEDGEAASLTAGQTPDRAQTGLVAAYDFSAAAPFEDSKKSLPLLTWTPKTPDHPASKSVLLDGKDWLVTSTPVTSLITALQKTNHFSIHVVCAPSESEGAEGRIVSISEAPGIPDLYLRQEEASIVIWFRSPLSVKRAILGWNVAGVFKAGQTRDILFTYDGSDLSLFVDGVKAPHIYRLGPGVGLARTLRKVKVSELEGYNYIYLVLIFFPAGAILGLAARCLRALSPLTLVTMAVAFILPSYILDRILVAVSGRPLSFENIMLSICLAIGGCIWTNADPRVQTLGN